MIDSGILAARPPYGAPVGLGSRPGLTRLKTRFAAPVFAGKGLLSGCWMAAPGQRVGIVSVSGDACQSFGRGRASALRMVIREAIQPEVSDCSPRYSGPW